MLKIEKTKSTINDRYCNEYILTMPKEIIETIINPYGEEFVKAKEKEKYIEYMIKKEIDEEEKIIEKISEIREKRVYFRIFTKDKSDINLENYVIKTLNKKMNLHLEKHHVDMGKHWIKIHANCRYNKENLQKISELLKAYDYEVIFNSHMEECYLSYKIR